MDRNPLRRHVWPPHHRLPLRSGRFRGRGLAAVLPPTRRLPGRPGRDLCRPGGRGRVGRGEHQSYCLLLADKESAEIEQRLRAVEQTSNGFELAEYDLKMRGPGEFFGTRQSGLPDLKLVKLTDTRLLDLARTEAQQIFEKDRKLEQPEHRLLAKQVTDFWKSSTDLS